MAKAKELTPEEKKAERNEVTEKRNAAVLRNIINMSKRQPEARLDALEAITHAIPMKLLTEAVEDKTIKQDYLEWLKENASHVIKKAGSGGGTREKKDKTCASWIEKVEDAPAKLKEYGKTFQANLTQFKADNATILEYFEEEYGERWKEYFRLIGVNND